MEDLTFEQPLPSKIYLKTEWGRWADEATSRGGESLASVLVECFNISLIELHTWFLTSLAFCVWKVDLLTVHRSRSLSWRLFALPNWLNPENLGSQGKIRAHRARLGPLRMSSKILCFHLFQTKVEAGLDRRDASLWSSYGASRETPVWDL